VETKLGTPHTLLAVDFPADDTGYAAGEGGDILRTLDGGATWEWCSRAETKENLSAVHFPDGRNGFAVGARGTLLKTSDGGGSWKQVDGAAARDLLGVHFLDGETGCVVGANGTALWTSDGGATWTLGGTGTPADLDAVHVADSATAYAAAGRLVIKTGDAGKSWTRVALDDSGHATGWDVGDGLFFDRRRFLPASAMAAFPDADCLCMNVRRDLGSEWETHLFTGHNGRMTDYASVDEDLVHGVGGTYFYRIDLRGKTMEIQNLETTSILRGIHCPETGACFAVGDQGAILKLSLP
jgi:photosystem II stability/assembly factor-like uncharacterized protein